MAQTKRAVRSATPRRFFEQQAIVGFVGRVRPGVARGVDAGRAGERVHHQPGIVREERAFDVTAVMQRLLDGVFFESRAVFDRGRQLAEIRDQFDLDGRMPGRQAELPELAGIAGGAIQPRHSRATCF